MLIQKITIPEPCHQPWQQMTPVAGGRHCESCCKTVVDFTVMTDSEIIKYLSTQNNACGRFGREQLFAINSRQPVVDATRSIGWKKRLVAILLFGFTSIYKADAQKAVTPVMHQQSVRANTIGKTEGLNKKTPKFKTIKGIVKDQDDKPIFAATIAIPGTTYWAQTDTAGNFNLDIPVAVKRLTVSAGDCHDSVLAIKPPTSNYKITLIKKTSDSFIAGPPVINFLEAKHSRISFDFRPVFRKLFN